MKVAINRCYGGFSLSPLAVRRMAELNGRACFLFKNDFSGGKHSRMPMTEEEISGGNTKGRRSLFFNAYDIPNPESLDVEDWYSLSADEWVAANKLQSSHSLEISPDNRHDPLLIQTIEELGEKANGGCAKLSIVEIPDGTDYEIDEYDGMESIHERHRSWA